jgi:hypothetical protein
VNPDDNDGDPPNALAVVSSDDIRITSSPAPTVRLLVVVVKGDEFAFVDDVTAFTLTTPVLPDHAPIDI